MIIVKFRKIKEKYHGHSDTNKILYVVHDPERGTADPLFHYVRLLR